MYKMYNFYTKCSLSIQTSLPDTVQSSSNQQETYMNEIYFVKIFLVFTNKNIKVILPLMINSHTNYMLVIQNAINTKAVPLSRHN